MERKTLLLRISSELKEELARWAADELRSVNGHIEFLLREAVRERRRPRKMPPEPPRGRDGPDRGPDTEARHEPDPDR